MPEPIKELSIYSLDTIQVPDGYDLKSVPDLTRGNLIESLAYRVAALCRMHSVSHDELAAELGWHNEHARRTNT